MPQVTVLLARIPGVMLDAPSKSNKNASDAVCFVRTVHT